MLTHNQKVLATIQAGIAVSKARQTQRASPQILVMEALREAIDSKRSELEALILAGKLDTEAYRKAKAQLSRWSEAWASNR